MTAGVALTLGAGDFAVRIGSFSLGGIGTAAFGAIILYQLLREGAAQPEEAAVADAAVGEGADGRGAGER